MLVVAMMVFWGCFLLSARTKTGKCAAFPLVVVVVANVEKRKLNLQQFRGGLCVSVCVCVCVSVEIEWTTWTMCNN